MSYALITGASKGIGKSIAFELAGKGCSLLLIARSEQLLKDLAIEIESKFPVKVNYLAIDLSLPDAPEKVFQWCIHNQFEVSILINNAGYGMWGMFEKLTLVEQFNMMQLNMQTMVGLTHFFIPLLKKNKKAHILNTSSTAAFQAIPTLSVYAATKAFVITFSRGLHMELKSSSIKVSCLIPGATDTGFMDRANMGALKEFAKKFEMTADEVAKIAVAAMFKGKLEIIPGGSNIISAVGTKFLPKKVAEKIAAGIYMKKLS
jgi:hypothetical protein